MKRRTLCYTLTLASIIQGTMVIEETFSALVSALTFGD